MFLRIRRKYWIILGVTVLCAALMIFMQNSKLFALQQTGVKGPGAAHAKKPLAKLLARGVNLFRLDEDECLRAVLAQKSIDRARFTYSLPDEVTIEVNRFQPAALVMDGKTLYGLDRYCRAIPFDTAWEHVDLPVLTGLNVRSLFRAPDDYRVVEVVEALGRIRQTDENLYVQIAEVNFSQAVEINVYLTSSNAVFLATADDFCTQIMKLPVMREAGRLAENGTYVLWYDNVVIKQK